MNPRQPILASVAAVVVLLSGAAPAPADADSCEGFSREVDGQTVLASAGPLDNLLRRANSIRDESERLLREAGVASRAAVPPADLCPSPCEAAALPHIVFRSEPTVSLASYEGVDRCERLLQDTRRSPLTYAREFDSVDALTDWIRGMARGRGAEGEDLYRRCDGRCSPHYTWSISPNGVGMAVDAEVVCGHARDRSDNRYRISYSLRWTCNSGALAGSVSPPVSAAP